MNAAYDGLRGNVGDSLYREYMPAADRDWFVDTGNKVRDAIAAVNGNGYTVEQAVYLYPTSGTSKDYAYSRHFVDAAKRRVYAYTLETGTEFQPAFPGAGHRSRRPPRGPAGLPGPGAAGISGWPAVGVAP